MSFKYAAKTPSWTFLTNHSHVLVCLLVDAEMRIRDVADAVGITERAAIRIVNDLEKAGLLVRHKEGRRNHYELHAELPLRHPIESRCSVATLLAPVLSARKAFLKNSRASNG